MNSLPQEEPQIKRLLLVEHMPRSAFDLELQYQKRKRKHWSLFDPLAGWLVRSGFGTHAAYGVPFYSLLPFPVAFDLVSMLLPRYEPFFDDELRAQRPRILWALGAEVADFLIPGEKGKLERGGIVFEIERAGVPLYVLRFPHPLSPLIATKEAKAEIAASIEATKKLRIDVLGGRSWSR